MRKIEFNGKKVNLDSVSMKRLKEILHKLDTQEETLRRELDEILEELA